MPTSRRRVVLGAFGAAALGAVGVACAPPFQPTFMALPPTATPPLKPAEAPKPAAFADAGAKPAADAAAKPTVAVAPAAAAKPAGGVPVNLLFWTHNYQ